MCLYPHRRSLTHPTRYSKVTQMMLNQLLYREVVNYWPQGLGIIRFKYLVPTQLSRTNKHFMVTEQPYLHSLLVSWEISLSQEETTLDY